MRESLIIRCFFLEKTSFVKETISLRLMKFYSTPLSLCLIRSKQEPSYTALQYCYNRWHKKSGDLKRFIRDMCRSFMRVISLSLDYLFKISLFFFSISFGGSDKTSYFGCSRQGCYRCFRKGMILGSNCVK